MASDPTVQTIAARVEAYQKKRALPMPQAEAIDAERSEVIQQVDNGELQSEDAPPGEAESHDGTR
jgi:hypothetical protein